jgi:hypothetical protein
VPYPAVKCFVVSPTKLARQGLRRYASTDSKTHYHSANNWELEPVAVIDLPDGCHTFDTMEPPAHDDPRWPTKCECGYEFKEEDHWQVFGSRWYQRGDTGDFLTLQNAPPGAMYDQDWLHGHKQWCGPDGAAWLVICPNGVPWHIDGVASNCTDPTNFNHKCWIRHGVAPNFTVDKSGGPTCAAGAGSILAGDYHGFLQNGVLTAG